MDIFDADPTDPDASAVWVLLLYGATMQSVQSFERALALLSLIVNIEPEQDTGDLAERYRRLWDKSWRAFQKDAAGQTLRRNLKDKIPKELYDRIEAFISMRRNALAHRFLLERVEKGVDGTPRYRRGTILELVETYIEVTALEREVVGLSDAARSQLPDPGPVPEPVAIAMEDLARATMFRQVRPEVLAGMQERPRESRNRVSSE